MTIQTLHLIIFYLNYIITCNKKQHSTRKYFKKKICNNFYLILYFYLNYITTCKKTKKQKQKQKHQQQRIQHIQPV